MPYIKGRQLLLHKGQIQKSTTEGPHYCARIKFYYNEVVCHQTYVGLIRMHIRFLFILNNKGATKDGQQATGGPGALSCPSLPYTAYDCVEWWK